MGRKSPISEADGRTIAAALRNNGNDRGRAAAESGFPVRTVYQYCFRHNVPKSFTIFDRTRKCGPDSKEDTLMASLKKHGNDHYAVVAQTGCSISTIRKWAKRNGVTLPKRGRSASEAKVDWNAGNVAKLRTLFLKVPRPSMEEMGKVMGTTDPAIQTVASRFGFTRWESARKADALHPQYQKPDSGIVHRERDCLICDKPFISEGSHHRQCTRCYANNSEIAA